MYSYREIDYNKDLPAIISLLKEGFHKKRILEDFKKKHIDNPFGKSYGLLAFEGDNLIALRMFLRWEFKHNNKLIKAIRPVDTVTHPQHQGKGIFKKINLMGLENCRNEYELIFNTPNKNSFPGNIKMGWKRLPSKQQFKIAFRLPFFFKSQKWILIENFLHYAMKYVNLNAVTAYFQDHGLKSSLPV